LFRTASVFEERGATPISSECRWDPVIDKDSEQLRYRQQQGTLMVEELPLLVVPAPHHPGCGGGSSSSSSGASGSSSSPFRVRILAHRGLRNIAPAFVERVVSTFAAGHRAVFEVGGVWQQA
jgi:hypothetical protein